MDIVWNDLDRAIWEEELADFVPETLYDAHTHVYDIRADTDETSGVWAAWPVADWDRLDHADAVLFPGRKVHRICFGNPLQGGDVATANAFTAAQTAGDTASAGLMLVRPEMTPETLTAQAQKYGLVGLKPYRTHSITGDAVTCRITDYLPEGQIDAANERHMMVMLHLSKPQAIADADNLNDLERLANRYGHIQWVLAHCARSYYDRPLLKAAERLKQIPNLWYEISSVCDADAMDALLSIAGPDRVMYGSDDIPVGVTRGKYITFGHAWASLEEGNHQFNLSHCDERMTFVRYESLRAFRRAVCRHGYGPQEIGKLFFGNARQLVDLTAPPAGQGR